MTTNTKLSSRTRLTQKQESFVLNYFASGNISQSAKLAKYSPKTADVIGRENLLKPLIQARLQELRDKAESAMIADVKERKERLTVFARANITDYMDAEGNISLDKNPQAVAELVIEDWQRLGKNNQSRTKRIKLHSPLQAIDLLNKMDKIYDLPPAPVNINVAFVIGKGYQDAKQLSEGKLLNGEKVD